MAAQDLPRAKRVELCTECGATKALGELCPQAGNHHDDSGPARVVCASCGRFRDKPAREGCDTPDWHQPVGPVPHDDDALPPETEEDLLAAVGPEPGKTWAELYARVALQLSYRSAELRGAQAELDRLRAGGRFVTGINDADSARLVAALVRLLNQPEVRVSVQQLETSGRLRVYWTPDTNELSLAVES